MSEITNSQVHRTLRNIILNDFGISKKEIEDEMRKTVRDVAENILREHILKENFLNIFIKSTLMKLMKEGVYMRAEYSAIDFDEYLNKIMAKTFSDMLKERFELNIQEKQHA